MARRTWVRCNCGAKLHVNQGVKQCIRCVQKKRKSK